MAKHNYLLIFVINIVSPFKKNLNLNISSHPITYKSVYIIYISQNMLQIFRHSVSSFKTKMIKQLNFDQ